MIYKNGIVDKLLKYSTIYFILALLSETLKYAKQ